MRRLVIAVSMLLVLLALGCGITWSMAKVYRPMARQLEQAAAAAMEEDWEAALRLSEEAWDTWQTWRRFTASVADHTPMDEVEELFAELQTFAAAREQVHFAATCTQLARMAEAMADSHDPAWWNFL